MTGRVNGSGNSTQSPVQFGSVLESRPLSSVFAPGLGPSPPGLGPSPPGLGPSPPGLGPSPPGLGLSFLPAPVSPLKTVSSPSKCLYHFTYLAENGNDTTLSGRSVGRSDNVGKFIYV